MLLPSWSRTAPRTLKAPLGSCGAVAGGPWRSPPPRRCRRHGRPTIRLRPGWRLPPRAAKLRPGDDVGSATQPHVSCSGRLVRDNRARPRHPGAKGRAGRAALGDGRLGGRRRRGRGPGPQRGASRLGLVFAGADDCHCRRVCHGGRAFAPAPRRTGGGRRTGGAGDGRDVHVLPPAQHCRIHPVRRHHDPTGKISAPGQPNGAGRKRSRRTQRRHRDARLRAPGCARDPHRHARLSPGHAGNQRAGSPGHPRGAGDHQTAERRGGGIRGRRRRLPGHPWLQPLVRSGSAGQCGQRPGAGPGPECRRDRRPGPRAHHAGPTRHPRLRTGHFSPGFPDEPLRRGHRPQPHDHSGRQPAQPARRRTDHLRDQRALDSVPPIGHHRLLRRRRLGTG